MLKKIFNIIVYIFAIIGLFLTAGFFAVKYGATDTTGIIDSQQANFIEGAGVVTEPGTSTGPYYWSTLPEWQVIKSAILKDKAVIYRASATADVSPRLIISQLAVEQLRLFYTERESFKKFFEPLKILGSQTQFSWGVMGIKEDTAIQIENNLKDKASPFYLGKNFENLLDFSTQGGQADIKQERFTRMTDQHAHYYSYLYAGIYLKQIETQWKKAGFDISNRPEIMTTLYNIGFANSKPNANPQSGGAEIDIG